MAENPKVAFLVDDGLGPDDTYANAAAPSCTARASSPTTTRLLDDVRHAFMRAMGAATVAEIQRRTHSWYRIDVDRTSSWDFRKIPRGGARPQGRVASRLSPFPTRSECVLRDLLRAHAESEPDRVFAVFDDGAEWTFRETAERSWRCAGGYAQLGLEQRDPVATWLPNGKDALVAWFGAAAAGLAYVPLNTAYRGALLEHTLNQLRRGCSWCTPGCSTGSPGSSCRTSSASSSSAMSVDVPDGLPWRFVERGQRSRRRSPPELREPVEPWDEHMLMFTGGTTGRSKAVRRRRAVPEDGRGRVRQRRRGRGGPFLVCAPMFHGGADVPIYAMLRAGGSVAIVPGFRTQTFWEDVRRLGCTVAWIHSAMAHFLWDAPARPDDRDNPLRLAMQAPLLPTFREFGERFDTRIYTVYGMTELPCPFSIIDPVDHRTLGKPIAQGVRCRATSSPGMPRATSRSCSSTETGPRSPVDRLAERPVVDGIEESRTGTAARSCRTRCRCACRTARRTP